MRSLNPFRRRPAPGPAPEPAPAPQPARRRDPAPSVWAYRYQRIMLTPLYRRALRVGLPAVLVMVVAGGWAAQGENRAAVAARLEALKDSVQERPAFMVTRLEVTGADPALAAAIREVARVDLPVSSFDLDLNSLRAKVDELTAVQSAQVGVRPGGALEIAVRQREPVAVWRYADGLRLIDAEGAMTGMIAARGDRADLPLIAGDGAKDAIGEALALFAAAAPVGPRVRGLVRMGERRWDMVLDDELRILLPTEGALDALDRVIALHQAERLLDRDLAAVDMRLGGRPTIRLTPAGVNLLRNPYIVSADAGARGSVSGGQPPIGEE